jgi:hypothetical protein
MESFAVATGAAAGADVLAALIRCSLILTLVAADLSQCYQ